MFAYRAVSENHAARLQQTSFGLITDCRIGRHSQKYCDYTFPVDGEQHLGTSLAAPEVWFGKTVVVYYNSEDPGTSALEDYSAQSHKDLLWACILLLAAVAFVGLRPLFRTPDSSSQ